MAGATAIAIAAGIALVGPAIAGNSTAPTAKPGSPPRFEWIGGYATDTDPETAGGEVAALRDGLMYVINGTTLEIVDVRDPRAAVKTGTVDLAAYGASITSVAVGPWWAAATLPSADKTAPGTLVLLRPDGQVIATTEVGSLPDMVTFDSTGLRLLVANEGEPNSYGQPGSVDPEGSVSVVNALLLSRGSAAAVRTIGFADFNAGGARAAQLPAGVRIYGPGASVAQDLEPEYIALDEANPFRAYVTLQENNAIAVLDLLRMRVHEIHALGTKDYAAVGAGLDPSDRDNAIAINTWPVKGMFLPDGIDSFRVRGRSYVVTANEGDVREWPGLTEVARLGSSAYPLDAAAFPNPAALKANAALGRLNVSLIDGKNAAGTAYETIHAYGGRSFSIWSADDGRLVWDSGDDFEQITAQAFPANFNSNNDEDSFDTRSDDKGPEPEGVAVGRVGSRTLAFVCLERVGGLMVYDVSDPARPVFLQYLNSRVFDGDPIGPDSGPEIVKFIDGHHSPNGKPMVLVSNEITGTVSLYQPVAH